MKGVACILEEVGFSYGARPVLENISFTVEPGEVVGLVGPNGSGKTTLIRLLSGVRGGYAGSILLDGREISRIDRRELARTVAVVPQESEAALPFSAREIVLMGRHPWARGALFESPDDLRAVDEALERAGAQTLADRNIRELSAGERQRIIFARALAQDPGLLLLDEPTSFLDIRYQTELYDRVRDVVENDGVSVLTVLHDLNLAAEYCDRICLLSNGHIHDSGPTDEVLTWANLTAVFATDVYVDTHDLTGKLVIIPLSQRAREIIGDSGVQPTR